MGPDGIPDRVHHCLFGFPGVLRLFPPCCEVWQEMAIFVKGSVLEIRRDECLGSYLVTEVAREVRIVKDKDLITSRDWWFFSRFPLISCYRR